MSADAIDASEILSGFFAFVLASLAMVHVPKLKTLVPRFLRLLVAILTGLVVLRLFDFAIVLAYSLPNYASIALVATLFAALELAIDLGGVLWLRTRTPLIVILVFQVLMAVMTIFGLTRMRVILFLGRATAVFAAGYALRYLSTWQWATSLSGVHLAPPPNETQSAGRKLSDVPRDWKERISAILSREGITQVDPIATVRKGWLRFKALGLGTLLCLCIAVSVVTYAHLRGIQISDQLLGTIAVSTTLAVGLGAIGRLQRLKAAKQRKQDLNPTAALAKAVLPPIIFLRSFAFDDISNRGPLSKEQEFVYFLAEHCKTSVIAIGRPAESAPPEGAARFYVRQDLWQQTIEEILPLCSLVVWTTGRTPGLHWEMGHLRENIEPRRLLIWINVPGWSKRKRSAEWQQFVEEFRDVFPKPLPSDIEHIRYIGFDDD